MTEHASQPPADTPSASRQVAQTTEPDFEETKVTGHHEKYLGEGTLYEIGHGVEHAVHGQPYERRRGDPLYRPLRIYTLDPAESKLAGSVETVNIPYEPLKPGPTGFVFEIDINAGWGDAPYDRYERLNLDDPNVLIRNGRDPSPSDPLFHQQQVYAVCSLVYTTFRAALGRHIAWGFPHNHDDEQDCLRLRVLPHVKDQRNAWYDKQAGQLCFGYYDADEVVSGRNLPSGHIFTCLSHDIVAHEVTHALLDGLRSHFTVPTRPEVLAFHEGLADLVAVFQHFSYEQVVLNAVRRSRGQLRRANPLTDLARQFGHTASSSAEGKPLRSAVDDADDPKQRKVYNERITEPHELGSILVSAVFDAFEALFRRKTERYVRLATAGSGVLPRGELSADLQAMLAGEASKLASQFLNICIRAIDYCPPVDLRLGDFLRAVITADHDLVPDDPWGYRDTWIEAFGNRKIYPTGVSSLAEDALLWEPPERSIPDIDELTFAKLQFEGDPGRPAGETELRRQAAALGQVITAQRNLASFGLARANDPDLKGDTVDRPFVQSVRTSRRVGPDGQVVFDLVAEVTQRRRVQARPDRPGFDFYGGATVIIGPSGEVRYVIAKSILSNTRLDQQRCYIQQEISQGFWKIAGNHARPNEELFKLLHT
ncbi:MAG: peptidase M4 [Planctomycetota bacterium]